MPKQETIPEMLSGGHPSSIGRTVDVVQMVLADRSLLDDLYACYSHDDDVIRLRTSNAFRRIWQQEPEWAVPYIDNFIETVSQLDHDSARWTSAQMFHELNEFMTPEQRTAAQPVLKQFLLDSTDWIVLTNSMQALSIWAQDDADLKTWLLPHLERFTEAPRKSISKKAKKLLATLT